MVELALIYAVSSVQRGSVGPGIDPEKLILPSIVTSRDFGNFCPKYKRHSPIHEYIADYFPS